MEHSQVLSDGNQQQTGEVIDDLFLFAHQDDEFAAVHMIEHGVRAGHRQLIVFLTDGQVKGRAGNETRNNETLRALGQLRVHREHIVFTGSHFDLPDGKLVLHLNRALDGLGETIGECKIRRVIMPAWEGGHSDHDAVHLIGLALARKQNCLDTSIQLPFYRAKQSFPGLTMFSPLAENGAAVAHSRTMAQILSHLAMARHYPTQAHIFAGIIPLTILHYLSDRCLYSQSININRVFERPTQRIKYEKSHALTYEEFQSASRDFIAAEIIGKRDA